MNILWIAGTIFPQCGILCHDGPAFYSFGYVRCMCKWCGRRSENVTVHSRAAKNGNRSIWYFIFSERLAEHAYTIFIYFVYNTTFYDDSRSTWYVCELINSATSYVKMGCFLYRFYIYFIYIYECVLKARALIGIDAIDAEWKEEILFALSTWDPLDGLMTDFHLRKFVFFIICCDYGRDDDISAFDPVYAFLFKKKSMHRSCML